MMIMIIQHSGNHHQNSKWKVDPTNSLNMRRTTPLVALGALLLPWSPTKLTNTKLLPEQKSLKRWRCLLATKMRIQLCPGATFKMPQFPSPMNPPWIFGGRLPILRVMIIMTKMVYLQVAPKRYPTVICRSNQLERSHFTFLLNTLNILTRSI